MKTYPALDVDSTSELLLALVDDCSPTAVEPLGASTRLFFSTPDERDAAAAALHAAGYRTQRLDVDDEDWARRSQENLEPITVGRITVAASASARDDFTASYGETSPKRLRREGGPWPLLIVILPSMGFGTGHHETTRLCLKALQDIDLTGKRMLDVGTGSGVLAIAADRLGAAAALGVDNDPDAIQSARDNLALNPAAQRSSFETMDVTGAIPEPADVVTANLTGTLLVRIAARLMDSVRPGGTLILSGILAEERDAVRRAFSSMHQVQEAQEGEWVALTLKRP